MASFGSNRAGVYVTPAPGERGSSRTVTEQTLVEEKPVKPAKAPKTKAKAKNGPVKNK